MDELDLAQMHEQRFHEQALQQHRARIARIAAAFEPRDPRAELDCIACGEAIEPERLKALGRTSRCASCAIEFESAQGRRG